MNERDPNVAIVELVAAALGALSEELVLARHGRHREPDRRPPDSGRRGR